MLNGSIPLHQLYHWAIYVLRIYTTSPSHIARLQVQQKLPWLLPIAIAFSSHVHLFFQFHFDWQVFQSAEMIWHHVMNEFQSLFCNAAEF